MGQKTPLYNEHLAAGAKIVEFGGWDMPLHYGSQVEEHHRVRRAAGMFDVSHMTIVDVEGGEAEDFLRHLVANDVAKLRRSGKALYTCMLNERGGVIDDLIVYFRGPARYRLVVNAATRAKDLAWINRVGADFELNIRERAELAMVAVQGPEARAAVHAVVEATLASAIRALVPFHAAEDGDTLVARTGYTGEDGYELMLPAEAAVVLWKRLFASGVAPAGLGARDTLRLEAGMNLYGMDMDENISPLESGLSWTVAWDPADRNFIGRGALETLRGNASLRRRVGLILEDKGVLRPGQAVFVAGAAIGEITSGGYSPTLGRSIALARVQPTIGERCDVQVRGRMLAAKVVSPPFVREGKPCVDV